MVFKDRNYVKIMFLAFTTLLVFAVGYAYYFATYYPIPITDRISFDAKLKFVREHIDPNEVDTVIIGSSIGLNNINGEYLEKTSQKIHSVVNLSVYEATALEAEQLSMLSEAFPHLKRIIYSAQYSDFSHLNKYMNFHADIFVKYMRHELGIIKSWKLVFHACQNIFFCVQRQQSWASKHMKKNKFEYLGFDKTGSVPLHIYGDDIISHRWRLPQPGVMPEESFGAVYRMSKRTQAQGIHFYLAHQPYREPLYEKYQKVREAMHYFDTRIHAIFKETKGKLIVLQTLHLNDQYFADRTHLNDQGNIVVAQAIAHFIDKNE